MPTKNKARNRNHPAKGSSIRVEPIRKLKDIRRIKKLREDNPRDVCLFTFGINTAYRANELLSIKVGDVSDLRAGDRFELWQQKTKKYRAITLNEAVVSSIDAWLAVHPNPVPGAALFWSQKTRAALGVSAVNHMVKRWCAEAGLKGNYGSHSLRKTWGYHQRIQNKAAVPLLMEAFGHSTQKQTLDYLGIQAEEIQELYSLVL